MHSAALIAGASSGLGADFAARLAARGPSVGLTVDIVCPARVRGTRERCTGAVVNDALRTPERDRRCVTPGLGDALPAHTLPRRPPTLAAAVAERATRKGLSPAGTQPQPKEYAA